ncbi:predicted protein [Nematostella vectensis]|uniref:Uncharacterized protein n=1 Tax=Nematostella vectensis TaxID=45351 RepID=A7T379_NEMVE|nr:predicted protein [Nematostella vectensis]|eukprot:XP_001621687.1 hypothetical protein NEMVEDRAFT_v1g221698 [Nematostella vectensis]
MSLSQLEASMSQLEESHDDSRDPADEEMPPDVLAALDDVSTSKVFYKRQPSSLSSASRIPTPSRTPSPPTNSETPVVARRREVTTLSTAEFNILNKIFDAFNAVSVQLKEQREVLREVGNRQEQLLFVVKDLLENQRIISEKIENLESTDTRTGDEESKIPPEISADIHLVHNNLGDEKQYNPEESLTSKHNTSVRKFLEDEVNSQEKGYQRKSVKRAAARYYETKRRLYLASLPANADKAAKDQQSNKLRSRRQRLYKGRVEVAVGAERNAMEQLSQEYMSDEEDGTGQLRGNWVVKTPTWRSPLANKLMARLQRKLDAANLDSGRAKKQRMEGREPSHRGAPKTRVEWALQQQREEEEEDEDSEGESITPPTKERRVHRPIDSSNKENF